MRQIKCISLGTSAYFFIKGWGRREAPQTGRCRVPATSFYPNRSLTAWARGYESPLHQPHVPASRIRRGLELCFLFVIIQASRPSPRMSRGSTQEQAGSFTGLSEVALSLRPGRRLLSWVPGPYSVVWCVFRGSDLSLDEATNSPPFAGLKAPHPREPLCPGKQQY